MKQSFDSEKTLRAWQRFVQMGELMPQIPAPIARSWFRCKNRGQLPIQLIPSHLAKTGNLPSGNMPLINAFKKTFHDLKEYLAWEELLLVLIGPDGTLLDWQGNSSFIISGTMEPGMCFNEATVGTMAMSLALEENDTFYVVGAHHYYSCYHQLASIATPVSVAGNPVGVLGACTSLNNNSLGITAVLLGKKALEAGLSAGDA